MTVTTRYGMFNLLETSSKTFSKVEKGVVSGLVRIIRVERSEAGIKVFTNPLSITDLKTASKAKDILENDQIATLCLLNTSRGNFVILEACKSRSSELSEDILQLPVKKVVSNDAFVVVQSPDHEDEVVQLSGVNYWNEEHYQNAVTFFKKWYSAVAAKARAAM